MKKLHQSAPTNLQDIEKSLFQDLSAQQANELVGGNIMRLQQEFSLAIKTNSQQPQATGKIRGTLLF